MSTTNRQNKLLVAEDWKRIYQSYQNADFKSYDFDNLRRAMINYLRRNYPEDFNDYIESSEYLALIDLIAFLGQNISFRVDLNSRENFLELAERRDSVLRIARMLSYNPKRNKTANGLLRLETVQTTETIYDSNGTNLSNVTIEWNDSSNPDWYEQFTKVLNAVFTKRNQIGSPIQQENINNISVSVYKVNANSNSVPTYSFSRNIDGKNLAFEVVSSKIIDEEIQEENPLPGNNLSVLYRDDGSGAGSANTGFFVHFRQGTLQTADFSITNPSNNQVVALDVENINNDDLWMYQLDSNGSEQSLWTKVDAIEGNNVVYNSINKNIRNIYFPQTRVGDRVNLVFSDGVFGNLPKGNFRAYYRTSDNSSYTLAPKNIQNVSVQIQYVSSIGKIETFTMVLGLTTSVTNSSVSEDDETIKTNAPALYYTQGRMITAEDYNVAPLTSSQDIIKVKSVNRTTSGFSRYFDLIDATGKYSNTNMFATDGVVYREEFNEKTNFSFTNRTEVEDVVYNQIVPIIRNTRTRNYFYKNFPQVDMVTYNAQFTNVSTETNLSTGYFLNGNDGTSLYSVGIAYTGGNFKYIQTGAMCKFVAPEGYHFMADRNNELMAGEPDHPQATTYKWVKVVNVVGDGTANGTGIVDGQGPISFNDNIPTGAILEKIMPKFAQGLLSEVAIRVVDLIFAYKNFGLRYDLTNASWKIILEDNLNTTDNFSLGKTGDNTNQNLDASWLILFETNGETYNVTYRNMRYIFESKKQVRFFYDSSDKVYDSSTGKVVKDQIRVLSINNKPGQLVPFSIDFPWEIVAEYKEPTGYIDTKKIEVTFSDTDDDGVVDDPDIFKQIVAPDVNPLEKYVFQRLDSNLDNVEEWSYIDLLAEDIRVMSTQPTTSNIPVDAVNGELFYFVDTNTFKNLNTNNNKFTINTSYRGFIGRDNLKFQYIHSADYNQRIDPSASNIIDVYMLTRSYDTQFTSWLKGLSTTKPLPPSTNQLYFDYGKQLNNIKSLSDEIVYHPVTYKVLFGSKAETALQAKIKIVKNKEVVVSDNDIKTRVIVAVDEFFDVENWDFGDIFYWSELSAYITYNLAPDIVSVVIVPEDAKASFGSLFQVNSEGYEIFKSGATVNDVEIIDEITATKLRAAGNITYTSTQNTTIGTADFTGGSN
jgi:hypothetical protein